MDLFFIYITNPSQEEAKKIARHLLEKRLIACANFFPITSLYWWEGKITDDSECVMIAKTAKEKWDAVKAEVEKMHPYQVPCIVALPAESNTKFGQWLKEQTT